MEHNQQQGLYDIYDIHYVPFWETPSFLIGLGMVVLGCIGFGLWWYIKKRKGRLLAPWEEALAHLAVLELHDDKVPQFYSTLTTILKTYLERRYNYQVAEKTDEEIVTAVVTVIPEEVHAPVQELFTRAVAYKFSKAQASHDQMKCDVNIAQSFIQHTTPQQTRT